VKIFDISWPISTATTGYKDRHIVEFTQTRTFDKDGMRDSTMHLSSHTGTHVDAPAHFIRDGLTIDEIKLNRLVGPCIVLDLMEVVDGITRDDLVGKDIQKCDIVLFKTVNSLTPATGKFTPHFVYLEASGAQYLAEIGVKAVGIDYLGIERSQQDHLTHTTLMHADIVIVEGLRLEFITPGVYTFVCLPLNIIGLEAAPARAILMQEMVEVEVKIG
jgi:arylformamidase